jgi:anti-anti-sigma factor
MSSAGLRSLVFAHQKMPPGMEIVLIGARPEVAETIRLTGFDRSIVMQEATEPR